MERLDWLCKNFQVPSMNEAAFIYFIVFAKLINGPHRENLTVECKQKVVDHTAHPLSLISDLEWLKILFYEQSPRKYGSGPGSNLQPLKLQLDSLSTALRDPICVWECQINWIQISTDRGPMFCQSWVGSKLFAKVISRRQKLSLVKKELKYQLLNVELLCKELYLQTNLK